MPRHTLRVLAVAAAALLAGYGCTDVAAPTATAPDAAALEKLVRSAGEADARFSASGRARSVSQVVGPEGGVLNLGGGHRLVFPAGALSQPTTITMKPHARYVGVELEPHGIHFPAGREPVLTINHSGVDVSGFAALRVVYVDDAGEILEVLPTQVSGATMTARLPHFSGFIGTGTRSDTGA